MDDNFVEKKKLQWWKVALIVFCCILVAFGAMVFFKKGLPKNGDSSRNEEIGGSNDTAYSEKKKFEVFPARLEDFQVPPKMYGLWPFGIKGKDISGHNEGHPGWDFELKNGSKLYAIADLKIFQIHDGDHQTNGRTVSVIEASANLAGQKFHIVYHSVINLEPSVKEGATVRAGEPLAEVGFPLSDTSSMIHFGIFPPGDSVGACPSEYFSSELQSTIDQIVSLSINHDTKKPYDSACVGKINREIYINNYPDKVQYLGGAEQWE